MQPVIGKTTYIIILIIVVIFVIGGALVYFNSQSVLSYLGLPSTQPAPTDQNPSPQTDQQNTPQTYAELLGGLQAASQKVDVESEVKIAQNMVALRPDSDQANLLLAQALIKKGSYTFNENTYADQAIVILNKLLEKNPGDAEVLANLGYANEIKQQYSKAFEYYNQAVTLQPANGAYLAQRGHAYELTGNVKKAEADYLAAAKLEPSNDGVLMNLARLYSAKGDNANVTYYANQILAVSSDNYIKSVAYVLLGTAAADANDYQGAIKQYSLAIGINPKYQNPYQSRAYIYISQAEGATDTAKRDNLLGLAALDINTALSIQSSSSFATWLQGYMFWVRGDRKQATDYFTKALGMVDTDITLSSVEKDNMRSQIKGSLNAIKS